MPDGCDNDREIGLFLLRLVVAMILNKLPCKHSITMLRESYLDASFGTGLAAVLGSSLVSGEVSGCFQRRSLNSLMR